MVRIYSACLTFTADRLRSIYPFPASAVPFSYSYRTTTAPAYKIRPIPLSVSHKFLFTLLSISTIRPTSISIRIFQQVYELHGILRKLPAPPVGSGEISRQLAFTYREAVGRLNEHHMPEIALEAEGHPSPLAAICAAVSMFRIWVIRWGDSPASSSS